MSVPALHTHIHSSTHTHTCRHAHTHTHTRTVFQTLVARSHPPIWVDHKLPFHEVIGDFPWACGHTGAVVVELLTSLAGEVGDLGHMQARQEGRLTGTTVQGAHPSTLDHTRKQCHPHPPTSTPHPSHSPHSHSLWCHCSLLHIWCYSKTCCLQSQSIAQGKC